MKKLISIIFVITLIFIFTASVMATDEMLVYSADSIKSVGGTVSIDKGATLMNFYNKGTSDTYNAYLDGFVEYRWFKNDVSYKSGSSITLMAEDEGSRIYCKAYLFSDAEKKNQCGVANGPSFVVGGAVTSKSPTITTTSIPDGIVGEYYYVKLECDDPDVTYSLFRSSLPDGMYLTQHGEIEGTPTKAGQCHINVLVKNEAGVEETFGFDFIIEEKASYSIEVTKAPDKVTYKVGEKLDMKGLKVRIYMPDGFKDLFDGDGLTYYTGELKTIGEQKIKLTYEDAFEFIIVTVVAADEEEIKTTEPTETTVPEDTTESGDKDQEEETQDEEEESAKSGKKRKTRGEDGEEDADMTWLWFALGGVGLAAVIAVVVIVIAKKKKQ